jgi:hypothetical protein
MSIVNILRTPLGSLQARDENGFKYHLNRKSEKVSYWRCAQKSCSVRMASRNSTSMLVGDSLPGHDHSTNILKKKAKEVELATIKKHASIPGTSTKAMVCEITNTLLSSSQPNTVYSMSSSSALKSALFREKKKANPLPPLPKSYADVIKTTIPSSLSSSADEKEFLILNSWTNENELESMMVFMSDVGADILRRAPIWMMDGTFRTAPSPFYQV